MQVNPANAKAFPSRQTESELDALNAQGKSVLVVPDRTGDHKIMWSKDDPNSVEVAKKSFEELKKKGYLIYKVSGKEGARGEQMQEFDPNAERLIAIPQMQGG